MEQWPSPESRVRSLIPAHGARRAPPRRLLVALILGALALAVATAAAADGLLTFRDPGPNEQTFPNEITCRAATTVCTPGRSADGRTFKLLQVGESGADVQIVGAGVDTGNGTQVTPLICTRAGNDIQCGAKLPAGEKHLGMYVPG